MADQTTLTPVDNPWSDVTLTPVEHDPFFGSDISDPYASAPHEVLTAGQRAGWQDAYQTFVAPIASAVTAPGDIMAGRLTPQDPRFVDSAITAGGLVSSGGLLPTEGVAAAAARPRMGFDLGKLMEEHLGGDSMPAAPTSPPNQIVAYHGSPHDFNQFDLSRIGSGEGAQAYGHGLYFAENEGVAKGYRDRLSPGRGAGPEDLAANILNSPSISGDRQKAIAEAQSRIDSLAGLPEKYVAKESLLPQALAILKSDQHVGGRMYQVGINADPEHFLDWDQPMSQQSPHVQQALSDYLRPLGATDDDLDAVLSGKGLPPPRVPMDTTGRDLQTKLAPNNALAAQKLKDLGIPGISYLDAGSRTAGSGSRNYVVFDDKTIDILKKYGLAGVGLGSAGLAASSLNPQPAAASPYTLTPVAGDPFAPQ